MLIFYEVSPNLSCGDQTLAFDLALVPANRRGFLRYIICVVGIHLSKHNARSTRANVYKFSVNVNHDHD